MRVYLAPPKDVKCPHVKLFGLFRRPMSKVCPTCVNWVSIDGDNPNDGTPMRGYHCAQTMQFLSTLEVAKELRQLDAKMTVEAIATRDAICVRLDRSNMLAIQQPAQLLIEAKHENHDYR